MQGRKRKPTALRIIEGNREKRPLPKNEPMPDPGIPACPKWLSKGARAEWRRLMPQLKKMGVLTKIDGESLARFCDCLHRYVGAVKFLDSHGSVAVMRNDKGEVKGSFVVPQFRIAKQMLEEIRHLGGEFGWTPAARAKLTTVPKKPKTLSEIAAERNQAKG